MPTAAPAPAAQDPTLEQKYRTLQGIHRGLTEKVGTLEAEVQALRAKVSAPPPPAPTPAPQPAADPKDVEAFGLDMVSMVQRTTEAYLTAARQAIEQRFAAIEGAVEALKQTLQGTSQAVAQTAEEAFFEKLTQLVPDWLRVNASQEFLAFLAEADPIYGVPRQAALDAAQAKNDANRAANVFKAFIATLPPPPATPPSESPSPRGAGSPPPPPAPQAQLVPQSEITAFYNDVARGKWRGRDQERLTKEAFYNAAIAEGRVR
jgi:hypothetical protein